METLKLEKEPKKQILIVFTAPMEVGGIERSLIGLLDSIDYHAYDVDLFLYAHHGPLMKDINSNVRLLPEVRELAYLRESFADKLKHGCFYSSMLRLADQFRGNVCFDETWSKVTERCVPAFEKHYDIAIGFFRPFYLLKNKVAADIKIAWVHTDYTREKTDLRILREEYQCLDRIAAVSEACRDSFLQLFPELTDRTFVFENILSPRAIRESADEFTVLDEMPNDGTTRILSIGRFCQAKNFDSIPSICRKILESGVDVKWYLIGFGEDEDLIKQRIREEDMYENVIILGKRENPYPYIRTCDLYVQPSRYEGKCVSVREAQILAKPVVITNYPTASSQLKNGIDGIILPMDKDRCANGISELLRNPKKMEYLQNNCRNSDYSNAKEVKKIDQMP